MPKYDFKCEECGHEFEKLLSLQKTGEVDCLKCTSKKTKKLLSTPTIILKGGGFYKTDSRKKNSVKKEVKPSNP